MTLDEISALTLDDVKPTIQERLFSKIENRPLYNKDTDGKYEHWYDALFTEEDMTTELVDYKNELISIENERLRKVDIETRFYGQKDMRRTFHTVYPEISNPAVFLRDLMNMKDHAEAERIISELEAKDDEFQNSTEKKMKDFEEARIAEYIKEGASVNGILEAIWEKVVEGDSTKADALQAKREAVKLRVPKPK